MATFPEVYNQHAVYRDAQGFHVNMAESYHRMIKSGDMTEAHRAVMAVSVRHHIQAERYHPHPKAFTIHFAGWLQGKPVGPWTL